MLVESDEENYSEKWWQWGGTELSGIDHYDDKFILTTEDAERLRQLAETLPGWTDGPDFAKNPLLFLEG